MKDKISPTIPWVITFLIILIAVIPQLHAQTQTHVMHPGDTIQIVCQLPPTPTPTPIAKPLAIAKLPPSHIVADGWSLTAAALRADNLTEITIAAENNIKVILVHLARPAMTDESGCFSPTIYRQSLDAYLDPVVLAPYVADGTIIGFMPIDEPHDWSVPCGPTHAHLNRICAYVHQRVDGLKCGYNARFDWLELGADQLDQLDYIWTQYNPHRYPDTQAWLAYQDAHSEWHAGPRIYSLSTVHNTLTLPEIQSYATALCYSRAQLVSITQWGSVFQQPGAHEVIAAIATACQHSSSITNDS